MRRRLLPLLPLLAAAVAAQDEPAADPRAARIYDLGKLTGRSVGAGTGPALELRGARPEPQSPPPIQPYARLMRAFVEPPLAPNEEIKPLGERWIAALCRPEQHAWIERFLATASGAQQTEELVTIAFRCLSMPEVAYQRDLHPTFVDLFGPDEGARQADDDHMTYLFAPSKGTTAFLAALEKNQAVSSLHSPLIALHPLQVGTLSTINETAYVRDFEFQVNGKGVIADPVVDVVRDGLVMNAAVLPLAEDKLGLALDLSLSELERPIRVSKFKVPGFETEVQIQLPNLQSTQVQSAVALTPGTVVVLVPPPLQGKRALFVVEVSRQKLDDSAPPKRKTY